MINFDTIHIQTSDIQKLEDISSLNGQRHEISIRDSIVYEDKEKGWVVRFDTTHKLHNPNFEHGIEFTVISFFLPHNFPANQSDLIDMIKAHHFHTDALLSEKSKENQIEGYVDIFLMPENASIQARIQSYNQTVASIIESQKGK